MVKMFPIQSQRGAAPHPVSIPWSVAEKAYSVYSGMYGRSQSLECLAGRGGFGPNEMDIFNPGWREECSEIARLRKALEPFAKLAEKVSPDLLDRHEVVLIIAGLLKGGEVTLGDCRAAAMALKVE